MQIIDLTHTFTEDMPVFPGDPKPSLTQTAHITENTFNDHTLTTVMHVGTHMDAPLHMIAGGKTIDALSVEKFVGRGIVLDVRGKEIIDSSVLEGVEIPTESIVLLYTGYGEKYRSSDYFRSAPVIAEDFARIMIEHNVKGLGMDISGPDADDPWIVHKILLTNEIYILENLTNLDQLLSYDSFEVVALPIKLKSDGAPVRVIAKVG